MRIRRPKPLHAPRWNRLEPITGRSWLDLAEPGASDGVRMLYALLDAGYLEAWRDDAGHVRLRAAAGPGPGMR